MRRWLSTKGRLGRRLLRRNRNALVGFPAAVGAVVLLAWLVLYVLPPTLVPAGAADWAEAESDARTALVQAVVGVALLVGLLFTARTLRLNRQGQITERFTKAIGQLGDSSKLDVRLGGIYALERIARDSADDHRTIMEVLTAFLREHSWEATPAQVSATQKDAGRRLRTDLQAVATVLGRRRREYEGERDQLDLGGVHLEGADLRGAHLEGAILRGARLEGAILMGARLEGADLRGARLEGAFLMGAHLEGAFLRGAYLEGAILMDARLEGAFLEGARLEGAFLVDAHLEGADLEGAHASPSTTWPEGFNPEAKGVTIDH